MRKSELTILLPPATLDDGGNITSRVYPLVISGTIYTPMVYVDDVHISPGNGVVDVTMTGEGLYNRRHTVGVSSTALPQAVATEMQPLEIRLLNLNPDSAVHVTILLSSVEAMSSGPPVSFGGAVRFRGMLPLGTDGKRPVNMNDRAGDKSVFADGPLWGAVLTVNDTFEVRNIRDITSQIRVLSPTGTGRIPVTGGSRRVIIVKKDGVTMEVEAESLDFRNIFDIDVPVSGSIRILGLLADSIANEVIKNGAITDTKIAAGAVTNSKLGADAVTGSKIADDAIGREHLSPTVESYVESSWPGVDVKRTHDNAVVRAKQIVVDSDGPLLMTGTTDGPTITISANGVTPAHLDRSYSETGHTHDDRYDTKSQVNTKLAGKSNTGHTHSLGLPAPYIGTVSAIALSSSGNIKQWTYDTSTGSAVRMFAVATFRADGGAGTTAAGTVRFQYYSSSSSSWVSLDTASDVQFDQGVDSSIVLTGHLGNPGNVQYRLYWTRTGGTMNITSGSIMQFAIPLATE